MIAVEKLIVDHIHKGGFHIVGNDKSVNDQCKTVRSIRFVTVAAGGNGESAVVIGQFIKMSRYHLIGKLCRPAVLFGNLVIKVFLGMSGKIMIEVTGADDIIPFFVFLLHISEQLLKLLCLQITVRSVCGQMGVDDDQFLPVFRLDMVDGIAAVEVNEL